MRLNLLLSLFIVFGPVIAKAQKFGYIDTEYIMSKMPDFKKAQEELNQFAEGWQKEASDMEKEISNLHASYKAEEVLLTEDMRNERMAIIKKKESDLKEFQKKVFGFEGLYFLKKKELVKPLQDKVWEATEKVAKSNRLAIIFDKSGELVMIYTDPRHDYTDFVLEQLGLGDPNDKIR